MKQDNLKDLFSRITPEEGSERDFMDTLKSKLDSVEEIRLQNLQAIENLRRYNALIHRNSRRAVVVAIIIGFASGILCSLLMPAIGRLFSFVTLPPVYIHVLSWGFVALIAVAMSLNSYSFLSHPSLSIKALIKNTFFTDKYI